MNKVEITRAAITKVTTMLAGKQVKVTQRGDQAFVAWDKRTHEVTRVNIPYLPDDATDELIIATQGYLDHEVAHILKTDPKARVGDHEKYAKSIDRLHNMVEDCWIEPGMVKLFPGSARNLSQVRRLVFQQRDGAVTRAIIKAQGGVLEETQAIKMMLVTLLRALAGHEECVEFMDDGDLWQFFPTVLPKIKDYYQKEIVACESSWDTLALARRVFADIVEIEDDLYDPGDGESEESEAGEEGESGEGESGAGESGKGDGKGEGEGEGKGGEPDEGDEGDGGDDESKVKEVFVEAIEEAETFEKKASDAVVTEYGKSVDKDGYAIFGNDEDRVEPYKLSHAYTESMMTELKDAVSSQIGPMQKGLERLLMAQKRQHYEAGQRRGRLNPGALFRLSTGDDRVFRKKHVSRLKNTAVQILVDCSGSMGVARGSRLAVAFEAAYGLAMTLERCRIPTQVAGFTAIDMTPGYLAEMRESQRRLGISYTTQREANRVMIYKGWGERMTHQVASRFADMRYDPNRLRDENIDPIAVEWAGRDLLRRQEERKVMMVLSDGQPAFSGNMFAARTQLKKVVAQCEAAGIETVGIGIQSSAVQSYYPKNVVINRIEELGTTMLQEMKRILLK